MILIPQCPDTLKLEALLDGRLSDQLETEVQEHIESCDDCQRRIDGLDAGDDSLSGLREHLKAPSEAIDTTLHVAMNEIKSISLSSDLHHLNNKLETSLDFLSSSDEPDSVGRLGRYEISEVIGRGGMGIVLKGYDPQLKRIVAIKVLAPELASNANARKRFHREGQAAAAVSHDHVVTIHGVDEANGLPYLVMEYISGRSLQDRIDRDGPLELKEILRIGMQVASGLAAAHAQGLVHRDIKPANILLENSVERVKITDFGLARAVDDVRITRQGAVTGTPEYMSPEQARSERVDDRSDLFSLGCVLYAMCTGRPPFRAESTVAIIRRVCDDEPRRLQEIDSEIPDPLANLVVKLLAKNPDERFQSAAEISDLLGRYLAHVQQPEANPSPPVIVDMPTNAANSRPSRFRHNWLRVAAVLLVLLTSFGFMEASGVTNFASTVIRLVQGEGIVVIEIDDPEVKVAIDGDDLVIVGPGIKEFRLSTGQHELTAHKAGDIIRRELLSITRDGKQLVRISKEPAARPNEELAGQKRRLVWSTVYRQVGVSPDGRYLSFVDWGNTFDLAIRDLATGEERRVTNEGSQDPTEFAYWSKPSPDGRQIAYSWGIGGHESRQLRVVDVDTGDYRILFDNPDGAYVVPMGWSQDGQYIAVALRPTVARVWQIELFSTKDGSHRVLKSLDWRFPGGTDFSPDGRYIVYAAKLDKDSPNSDIFLLATDGSREVTLVEHPAVDSQPFWTPDGRGIVFLSDRGGSKSLWYLEMADAQPQGDPTLLVDNVQSDHSIGFTSDGSYYFLQKRHNFRLSGDVYVAILDPAGGTIVGRPTKVVQHHEGSNTLPAWSANGNYLAYTSTRADQRVALIVRDMKTGQERELKPRIGWWLNPRDCLPRWSPDGKTILVSRGGLKSIDVQSGDVVPLVQHEDIRRFVYSQDGTVVYYVRQLRGSDDGFDIEVIEVVSIELATETVKVLSEHDPNDGHDYGLALSPDGQQLALASLRRIWLMPIEGGTPRQLLTLPEDEVIPEHVGIAWTPIGNSLIFAKRLLGPKESYGRFRPAKRSELWKVSVDSGVAESLNLVVDGLRQLSLHPDGRQITYTQYPPGADPRTEIWAINGFLPRLTEQQ